MYGFLFDMGDTKSLRYRFWVRFLKLPVLLMSEPLPPARIKFTFYSFFPPPPFDYPSFRCGPLYSFPVPNFWLSLPPVYS